jgi:large subunit ribosomal protein L17
MRNRNKINQLGRTASHRNALMMNLANALITHKRISTTVAKAKALRGYVEPLITKSKNDTTHSRRMVFRHLQNKEAVAELFREVAPKVGERPGGYTRIIKTGFRAGDSAEMCIIELVDFNEVYTTDSKDSAKKKTRRSRRGGGSKSTSESTPKQAAAAETAEEAVATEEVAEDVKEEAPVEETAEAATEEVATEEAPAEESSEESEESDDDKKEASN